MRKIDVHNFKRATRSTSRKINRRIVLNLVREHQPISRADLARHMDVGRGRITSLVGELLKEGVICEGGTVDAPRGRRPKMLYIRSHDRLVVAIDVRFSRTYLMLSDFAGTEIALETFPTETVPEQLIAELAARVRRLLQTYGGKGHCEGIGLVVPGMVDQNLGRVLNAPQLGWRDVDLRDPLANALGIPVSMENASLACALAQMWLGRRGDGVGDFVYVGVFEGVGTGIVVNGQLVRGGAHAAGEFGHIPLNPDGPRCLCGARGCLEAYTSNLATLSRYLGNERPLAEMRTLLQKNPLSLEELVTRARTGDAAARDALDQTGRYLGLGLSMIVNALNPSRIFVGGEITAAWDLIEPRVRSAVVERALTKVAAHTPVLPEGSGSHPRLRGALALVTAPAFAAPEVA